MKHKTVIIKDGIEDMILTYQVRNSSVERLVKIIKENRKEIERLKESEEYHRKGFAELHKRIDDALEYMDSSIYQWSEFQKIKDILKGVDKE